MNERSKHIEQRAAGEVISAASYYHLIDFNLCLGGNSSVKLKSHRIVCFTLKIYSGKEFELRHTISKRAI